MRSIARSIIAHASAAAAALALSACAGSTPSSGEAAASADAAFAMCSTASITIDRRTRYQAPIAEFLEEARTSGCSYGGIQIAYAPELARGDGGEYADAVAVARDFIDAFALPWRLEPETDDPTLSEDSLRVTVLLPNAFAAAQPNAPQYR